MRPFFVIVPKHGRAFPAKASYPATSLLWRSVLVKFEHGFVFPERAIRLFYERCLNRQTETHLILSLPLMMFRVSVLPMMLQDPVKDPIGFVRIGERTFINVFLTHVSTDLAADAACKVPREAARITGCQCFSRVKARIKVLDIHWQIM